MGEITVTQDPAIVGAMMQAAGSDNFPGWDSHPLYGDFARALNGAINEERQTHTLCSFAVVDGDEPLILAAATCDGDSVSSFGIPLALGLRAELGKKRQKKAFAVAFDQLRAIAAKHGSETIRILGSDSDRPLGAIDLASIDQRAQPLSHIHAIIDLAQDEPAIHSQLRDSYRSLVNWGRRQLQPVHINIDNPDRAAFDLYPDFHAKIAGGVKYGNAYWDVYWDQISNGRGELSLGYLEDGTLATGTLVIDAADTSYYASGVYERELFDKPLGHFPVFDSIIRAAGRGMATYDLGEIFPAGAASDKEMQIGFFKKGFTSSFRLRTVWVLNISTSGP